jgi:hypothetical protein
MTIPGARTTRAFLIILIRLRWLVPTPRPPSPGLANLRKIVSYAQQGTVCRRKAMGDVLGDDFDIETCERGCDVCDGTTTSTQEDLTDHARTLITTLRTQFAAKEKRATHKQLADLWLKGNRGKGLAGEDLERFVNHLLIQDGGCHEVLTFEASKDVPYVSGVPAS